jgi:hypothetical protein
LPAAMASRTSAHVMSSISNEFVCALSAGLNSTRNIIERPTNFIKNLLLASKNDLPVDGQNGDAVHAVSKSREKLLGRYARRPQANNRKSQRNAGQLTENLFDDI